MDVNAMKKMMALLTALLLAFQAVLPVVYAEESGADSLGITAPSAILMEASTGTVVLEKNAHEKLPPASVTKIMTLLLIFDTISQGKIQLDDTVTTSEYAASMGGSQVFLEAGETQSVDTMIKCISVASANDASVAMAEYVAGTETLFVEMMNERAKGLGMNDTHFVNCCGLDDDAHLTTARDVAVMSREILKNHPQIHEYCTIWMENIVHTTARGDFEFGLSNTNKLIKQYEYATGLKTGYTSVAGFCVSASAKKDNIELVAVIMGGADSKSRFQDAITLLNSGFACCSLYQDTDPVPLPELPVKGGVADTVTLKYAGTFSYVSTDGTNLNQIERTMELPEEIQAPLEKGSEVGRLVYRIGGTEIGNTKILTEQAVEQAGFSDHLFHTVHSFLL